MESSAEAAAERIVRRPRALLPTRDELEALDAEDWLSDLGAFAQREDRGSVSSAASMRSPAQERRGGGTAPMPPPSVRTERMVPHPTAGELIDGRFRIDGLIAEGRIAQLFTALSTEAPRRVALKILLPRWYDDGDARRRFLAAGRAAMKLAHPAIVPTIAAGEDRGRCYVASEHVAAEDLDAYVAARGAIGPTTALRIAREVVRALEHARSRGVVHGGLGPSNVLVARDPRSPRDERIYVADFGMAEVAPPRAATADAYAVGALIVFMLTGRAFDAETWRQGCSEPSVVALLERLLREDASRRLVDVTELAAVLDGLVTDADARGDGEPPADRTRKLPPASADDDLVGSVLDGRFEVVSFLRRGGMAHLYAATQDSAPRHVAIKVLRPRYASEPEVVQRFVREAHLAARLDHPHIVRLVHVGDDPARPYIAMELLSGEDLAVRLAHRGRLSEAEAVTIGAEVTSALAYAHELGVVHRDIKPQNVMLCPGEDGDHIKLVDFGIAKVLEPTALDGESAELTAYHSVITRAGALVGTPRYLAPEQGRAEEVDHRADLYSLGVVLYELVTGAAPFEGGSPLAIVSRHIHEEPRRPSHAEPEIHPDLERLILELLRKDPAARPSSARGVGERLRAMLPRLATVAAASTRRWCAGVADTVDEPPAHHTRRSLEVEPTAPPDGTRSEARGDEATRVEGSSSRSRRRDVIGERRQYVMPTLAGEGVGAPGMALATEDRASFLRLGEVIGRGGMGEVFRADQIELGRPVAFKQLIDGDDDELRARFLREARITAQLDHPHIVPVHVIDVTPEGRLGYAMKLVRGKTLRVLLKETARAYEEGRPIDDEHALATRLEHFLKVCDAIAFAHSHGILHRDLKPANIMIGKFHEVYVMDWGVARPITGDDAADAGTARPPPAGGDDDLTRDGAIIGSAHYASPEQALGRNQELDARADQYSLGLILYELVSLRRAIGGESIEEVWVLASRGHKEPLAHLSRHVRIPSELRAIVAKATAFEPGDRYASVDDLAEDLRRFLRGDAVAARPDLPLQRLARWMSRHRRTTLTAFLVVLALAGTAVALTLYWRAESKLATRKRGERKTALFIDVAAQAYKIDAQFQRMEEALEGLRVAAEWALAGPEPAAAPVYLQSDFADPNRRPADFTECPAPSRCSYRWGVSFEHPVAGVAPSTSPSAVLPKLRRLAPLREHMRAMFVTAADTDPAALDRERMRALLLGRKSPIDYAYVSLKEGVQFMLPGMASLPPGYDVRTAGFYQMSRDKHGRRWGSPYVDSTTDPNGDDLVLPCTQGLWSPSGEFLGIAGVEITVTKLVETGLALPGYTTIRTSLVNDKGKKVIDSGDAGKRFKGGADEELPLFDFDIAEVAKAIRDGGEGLFELDHGGRSELVAFARLDVLGWYYVVELDASVVDRP